MGCVQSLANERKWLPMRKAGSLCWVTIWVANLVLLLGSAGCQKSHPEPQKVSPQNGQASAQVTPRPNPQNAPVSQSDLKALTGDPVSAVKVFLEAVRTGDDERVVQLFSEQAREQAGKLNRQFAPVGSDTARYEVFTDVEYLAPDGARVRSTWTDLDSQGKMRTDEITWMLRKESDGWRIAGMATVIFEGEPPLLLDFENMTETLRKLELLSEEIERRAAQAQEQNRNTASGTPAAAPEALGASGEASSGNVQTLPAAPATSPAGDRTALGPGAETQR